MSYAVLFPGQGSQFVGMGEDLFRARGDLLGAAADDVLGWSLSDMCLNGPEERLARTEHAQPALYALSYALYDEFCRRVAKPPAAAAGHSLGEYTALAASGYFNFESGLSLVAARGAAMAAAADLAPSGMAALIGADDDLAERVCQMRSSQGGRLEVANVNAPGQIVLAGGAEDIDWLSDQGRLLGVRRVVPLEVAGAFHSSHMASAVDQVAQALEGVDTDQMAFPVWASVTAAPHLPDRVRAVLADQVVSRVRFRESLESMADDGIDAFVHVGPGDVTAGMAKRTLKDATVLTVSSTADIAEVASVIGTMA